MRNGQRKSTERLKPSLQRTAPRHLPSKITRPDIGPALPAVEGHFVALGIDFFDRFSARRPGRDDDEDTASGGFKFPFRIALRAGMKDAGAADLIEPGDDIPVSRTRRIPRRGRDETTPISPPSGPAPRLL